MPSLEKYVLRDGRADTRTWRQRIGDAVRSLTLGPYNPRDPAIARLFGGRPSTSGVAVNHSTALSVSAFFCAVTMIAWDIASLPLFLLKALPDGRGKTRFTGHPLHRILHDQANPQTTAFQLRATLMINVLTTGNSFCEIERDVSDRPHALWHIGPERVTPFYEGGELRYRVTQPNGGNVVLDARDMIHLRGPSADAVFGLDTVQIAREALGLAVAAEQYGGSYFANGTNVGGILTSPTALSDIVRKNLREAIEARHTGSDKAHRLLLLESGLTYTSTATTPRDSQFEELRTHQIREVARFFRIPVSMLGDLERSTYSNSEQQSLSYYTSCLRPWLTNVEQEFASKLIAPSERNQQSIEHVVEGFLRADSQQRGEFYASMVDRGIYTVNECRALENLPPIPGGDVARVPMNTAPITEGANNK